MSYLISYNKNKELYRLYRPMMYLHGLSKDAVIFDTRGNFNEYRHIRLTIFSPGLTMQFSNMHFETEDGIKYQYPEDLKCWVKYNGKYPTREVILNGASDDGIFFGSEKFLNVLNNENSMAKVCWGNANYDMPIYFYIDLKSKPLNIKRYKRWGWHTANDSTGPSGQWKRNMKEFKIDVSNYDSESTEVPESEWTSMTPDDKYELSDYDREYTYGKNLPEKAYAKVGPFILKKQ